MDLTSSSSSQAESGWALYRRLFSYLLGYWKIFAISVLSLLTVAATGPAFAYLIKPLINEGFVAKNLQAMSWIPLAIIGLFLVRGTGNYINAYASSYLSGHLVQSLRSEMFEKMLHLPINYYRDQPSGRVMSRVLNDVNQIIDASFNVLTVIVKDGVAVLGLLGLLFYTDWQLTLITFATIPIVAVSIRFVSRRLRHLSRENQSYMGQMTQVLGENIDGAKEVKIYGGQKEEAKRFNLSSFSVRRNIVKQSTTSVLNTSITQLLIAIALSLILYFAAARANTDSISAGAFMSFLTAMIMMFDPLRRITGVIQSLQRGLAAAESVFTFLDISEEPDEGQKVLSSPKGHIRFDQVSFRYEHAEKDSLKDIELNLPQGTMTALVGASGCGKSTLVSLLPRFSDPKSGKITLDGVDIKDYTLASLRRYIALVSQEVVLFNGSISDNIAYGEAGEGASEEKIISALRAANAMEFVSKLPEGIHTLIGENGAKLSGGQRQRLAIARAILKDAPILILDEATSALDSESEKVVQAALEGLMENRTTVVIAHRLSTIENADNIVVMDEGRIVEMGKHHELLARKGRYEALHAMQFMREA